MRYGFMSREGREGTQRKSPSPTSRPSRDTFNFISFPPRRVNKLRSNRQYNRNENRANKFSSAPHNHVTSEPCTNQLSATHHEARRKNDQSGEQKENQR